MIRHSDLTESLERICTKGFNKGYKTAVQTLDTAISNEINSVCRGSCDDFIVDRIEEILEKYRKRVSNEADN